MVPWDCQKRKGGEGWGGRGFFPVEIFRLLTGALYTFINEFKCWTNGMWDVAFGSVSVSWVWIRLYGPSKVRGGVLGLPVGLPAVLVATEGQIRTGTEKIVPR